MRAQQIDLQLTVLLRIDVDVAQHAHACSDGICNTIVRDQVIHHGPRAFYPLTGCCIEQYRASGIDHVAQVIECEVIAVDMQSLHVGYLPFNLVRQILIKSRYPCTSLSSSLRYSASTWD